MTAIIPVILCGGGGTRLWPRSRATKPKPFLPLVDNETLFVETITRCPPEAGFGEPVVVTGTAHLPHVQQQLGDRPGARIIVEPAARNTAAAIALAAMRLPGEAVMLVCPSDHHIGDPGAFAAAARAAAALAEEGWLVALGIEARSPETGFGYLKRGEAIGALGFRVARFVEKPDRGTRRRFSRRGRLCVERRHLRLPCARFPRRTRSPSPRNSRRRAPRRSNRGAAKGASSSPTPMPLPRSKANRSIMR